MISTWRVRLELARDDGGALSDEGLAELTRLLTEDAALPVVSRGDAGSVLVQITIDARDARAAGDAADDVLRNRASEVWAALGLPPFTIAVVEAVPDSDPKT